MNFFSSSKSTLLKGSSLFVGAAASTAYGAYEVYKLTNNVIKEEETPTVVVEEKTVSLEDTYMKVSDVERNSKNYKDPSPIRWCVKKLFDDIKIPESNNPEQDKRSIEINKNDFFTKIGKTTEGCFNMRTENKDNGDIIGFVELTAIAEDYGLIMQSEINLKKENKNSESYFFNKLLFLKKKDNNWGVQKIVSFKRETDKTKGKKPDEIVDSPRTLIKLWSKKSNGSQNELLIQKFDLKIQTDFWKKYIKSNFDSTTEDEAYVDGKWYRDSNTQTTWGWHDNIPKGKWTDVNSDELCKKDDLKDKDFCTKKQNPK